MRPRSHHLLLLLATGCATVSPLRPDGSGRAEVGGVEVSIRADAWHDHWLSETQTRVTPVELTLRNGADAGLLVRPDLFTLVLPNGARLAALAPGRLHRALPDAFARNTALYSWPGLRGPGPTTLGVNQLGPDPRPIPDGVVEPGGSASVLLFFDTPADRLAAFVFEAELQDSTGAKLGVARLPFRR
jgi:hypothetical protein